VAQQEFDLFKVAAVLAAEFGAGAAEVVGAEVGVTTPNVKKLYVSVLGLSTAN
jgi:hypothetical protein